MKEISELLAEDRESVLNALTAAADAAQARQVADREWDRLLMKYQEQQEDPESGADAVAVLQSIRACTAFADTIGKTKVWTREMLAAQKKRKFPAGAVIFLIAALLCAVAAVTLLAVDYPEIQQGNDWWIAIAVTAGAVVFALLSGLFFKKKEKTDEAEMKVDIQPDAQKFWRAMQEAALTADRQLALRAEERKAYAAKLEEEGNMPGKEETDLYAALLEAKYSKDGEFALDALADLSYFLHKKEIEAVEYSKERERIFECLPGEKTATLRPALLKDGKLLKKGLATVS